MKLTVAVSSVLAFAGIAGCSSGSDSATASARIIDWSQPHLVVDPGTTRAIGGISELDRKVYFSVCDPGAGFENRIKDDAMYDYLVNELDISFGRLLGPVKWTAKSLKEDPNRPGYADIEPLKKTKPQEGSEKFRQDFGSNLDVAAHGFHNAFPEFMGQFTTELSMKDEKHPQWIPENIDAAAELAAAVFKYTYTDFTRPRYYEPVNEPHWSFFGEQHMADWHLKMKEKVKEATPEVQVGGLCMSVSYFYKFNYRSFQGISSFVENTKGQMDFYSFHTYDYLRWHEDKNELYGRLQSGLTLEGSLDLVQNYTMNSLGREVEVVISEHGGYIGGHDPKGEFDGEAVASIILKQHYPDADLSSWEYEMKKRSIASFGHVSSCIANTLGFMDHPHTVKKAVPFLLINTWSWDPKYYAGLYVPKDYTDKEEWVESDMALFYRFFRGVSGRRVKALCSDPDLQARAFVDGSQLFLVVNNQSFEEESVNLHGIETDSIQVRRFGRNADFTTSYAEETMDTPEVLQVAGRESLVIIADYGQPIQELAKVNEVNYYATETIKPVKEATFQIEIPANTELEYAQLRIGLTREPDASPEAIVTLNGKTLKVPLEDSAGRFTEKEYAMTKLIPLDVADLQEQNTVTISFPDSDEGYVGTAVIRGAVK
ncbi:MAG: beta-agarase [Verrucomicrobiota bacterium]